MKPLSRFATSDMPLHPSALKNLIQCPWRAVMLYLAESLPDESAGEPADTGSAMHRAAEAWHKEKKGVADCLEVMRADRHLYPHADLQTAAGLFLKYTGHSANKAPDIVLCEHPIAFSIKAAPHDPTGEAIEIIGEVDQVRRMDGRLKMWDIKTSSKPPVDVLQNSTHQAAAYCIGASYVLGEKVHPGGVIMPRQNGEMFIPFTWKFEDIEHILAPLRYTVALIRSGIVYHVPDGNGCKWCHAKSPDLCLPRKKRALL